ncbi:hypothetical protein ACOSOMT5_P1027 [Acidiphilium sp. MT5]
MSIVVVDTNVVLVANGQHQDVSDQCVVNCAERLQAVMQQGRLALDDCFRILLEYQNKTTPKNGNRPGDAFVKWALQNNANTLRVECVKLEDHADRAFVTFPDDRDLEKFDPPDRKFVAVASAHPEEPPILQAADSKWLGLASALKRHSITVDFLCHDDIKRFRANKSKP